MTKEYLDKEMLELFDQPNLNIIYEDGRKWLNREKVDKKFDMVILNLPDPATAFINRYYTKECYSHISQILKPNGILVTSMTSSSNYLSNAISEYLSSVYNSLSSVFNSIEIFPGETVLFIASNSKNTVSSDTEELMRRHLMIDPGSDNFDPAYFSTMVSEARITHARNAIKNIHPIENSDLRPVTYFLNLIFWNEMAASKLKILLMLFNDHKLMFFAVLLFLPLLLFILFNRPIELSGSNIIIFVIFTGFVSISIQLSILFLYQNFLGFLYRDIAVLSACFMSGIAAGGFISEKMEAKKKVHTSFILSAFFLSLICIFMYLGAPLIHQAAVLTSMVIFFCLSLFTGMITGFVFPLSLHHIRTINPDLTSVSANVEAADHMGASLGAVLTGTLLIPVFGFKSTILFFLFLLLISSIFISVLNRRGFTDPIFKLKTLLILIFLFCMVSFTYSFMYKKLRLRPSEPRLPQVLSGKKTKPVYGDNEDKAM
ncbi:hypothetical protein ACFLR5_02360, partial [Elusimicrobiota bacterium]